MKRHAFEFDPEIDLKRYQVWYLDGSHSIPPWTPMFAWTWCNHLRHAHVWAAGRLSLPNNRGTDWREIDGCAYCTPTPITDAAEIRQRETLFRERIRPFLEDYDAVWQQAVRELHGLYDPLKRFDYEEATFDALYENWEDVLAMHRRMWELHFYLMYATYTIYTLFEGLCRELLGIDDTSTLWHRLMQGFDNDLFEADRKLWELRLLAEELGLTEVFLSSPADQLLPQLRGSARGRQWAEALAAYLDIYGWRMPRMMEFNCPSWREDPTPVIRHIQQFLAPGVSFDLDRKRPALVEDRQRAEAEVLARVPPEQREWFSKLMAVAQKAGVFSESHDFHFEHQAHAIFRRALLGYGRRLAAKGCLAAADDPLFLVPDELRKALGAPEYHDLRPVVAARRKEFADYSQRLDRPTLIGNLSLEEATAHMVRAQDSIMMKITIGEFPQVRPELAADLYGIAGSPGVAEGPARVILDERDVGEVQAGEILVAPITYSGWTPIFPLLKGVVTDRGGSLAHAAVVGREYHIPIVVNTLEATKKIRTGQRLRIDGYQGVVYILE